MKTQEVTSSRLKRKSLYSADYQGIFTSSPSRHTEFWLKPVTAVKGQLTTGERPGDSLKRQLIGGNRFQGGRLGPATQVRRIRSQHDSNPLNIATKSSRERIPPESARAGVQDD